MVLKSQITTMRKLKAICLFAPHQSDRQYSQKLKAHFRYFQKLYLQQLDCWEVKKQHATDLDVLLENVDVIFLITSMELINALEENYSIKAKLERVTNQQKAKVISIKVAPFICKMGFISKTAQFPANSYLEDPKWEHLNNALNEVHDEVEHVLLQEQKAYDEMYQAWEHVKIWNSKEVYDAFCRMFPNSPFFAEAAKKRDALKEAHLWGIVERVANMRAYLMYIQYSPTLEKLEIVAEKMAQIEVSEDFAKAERRKFSDLLLDYQFKNEFRTSAAEEALDAIDEYWNQTVQDSKPSLASITANNKSKRYEQRQKNKQLNASFLDSQASVMLNTHEQAVYYSVCRDATQLKKELAGQQMRWKREWQNGQVALLALAALCALCWFQMSDFFPIWISLLAGIGIAYFKVYTTIQNYLSFLRVSRLYVRLRFPIIKAAILLKDQRLRKQEGKHLGDIDHDLFAVKKSKWTDLITGGTMIDYSYLLLNR
jgi:hypothetical protein